MTDLDVLIIGGGPAGMSALIWCHSLGLSAAGFECEPEAGGQMLQSYHRITNYPGLPGLTGRELRDRFISHVTELGLDLRTDCRIKEADLQNKCLLCNEDWVRGRAVIIATGARKRRLGVPGEERFETAGVSYSGTRDHSLYAGKRVSVVGGGDSAVENALILARVCPEVSLIHRSDKFRARDEWLREARDNPIIRFVEFSEVKSIEGTESVERILLTDVRSGKESATDTEAVFIKIGIDPNTKSFRDQVEMNQDGFILVDNQQKTSIDLVYAAGDVCRPACLSIATAVGQAAVAAKNISEAIKAIEVERQ